jgi:dipeptidyl aminopeptidase/acylaminoacyl peptidase
MKKFLLLLLIVVPILGFNQAKLDKLTVDKIMRDPKWIGSSPSNAFWSADGKYLFFSWNPGNALSDSLYYITTTDLVPKKATHVMQMSNIGLPNATFNTLRTALVYEKNGDIFLKDLKANREKRITQTTEVESSPQFLINDSKVAYSRNQNIFTWDISTGITTQVTNFQKGPAPVKDKKEVLTAQEQWLKNDQLANMEVLKWRKLKRDSAEAMAKAQPKEKELREIYYDDRVLSNVNISPDGRFITYRLVKTATNKNTIVPTYVTETGFTTDIPGRTKVGAQASTSEFFVFDAAKDTIIPVKTDSLPGIKDIPDYVKDYAAKDTAKRKPVGRNVTVFGPYWNDGSTKAVVEILAQDNKDRWIMLLNASNGQLKLLDRQRDEAWIGGPGIAFSSDNKRWLDDNTYWYQSEKTGYSHLYKVNVATGEKTPITSGKYEVQRVQLSNNKKDFFITTNQAHPGEKHLYRVAVNGGQAARITNTAGSDSITISPDEKFIAVISSESNKPWELYLQENKLGANLQQVTNKAQTEEFKSYSWRQPEVITFAARDSSQVYARLYKPATPHATKPAVIFVHGAGYLQNAHKWWSTYFREYMFHNLLVDNGYTVLDIDYRGSAGYGRNWRTGIYRYMGGKDLSDQVDGAKYLVQNLGIDSKRIGIYGGSYGGFITLMGMFTEPDVFAAGAALRSVTDWAHYNHPYTANILNEPFTDSIAYRKSSPIYHASGLKGALLMCHGMVDVNVHFQDIVRLTQRLIELKKENWELAVYPMEDHGFVEPSSWTDEYKRIFKLFETNLKK